MGCVKSKYFSQFFSAYRVALAATSHHFECLLDVKVGVSHKLLSVSLDLSLQLEGGFPDLDKEFFCLIGK